MAENEDQKALVQIEKTIGIHPDFPKPGILFRDVMPVLGDPTLFKSMINLIATQVKRFDIDRVLGIESRGFLIAPMLAMLLDLPFGPIRKRGKLPGPLYSVEYELEYGRDVLEIQKKGLPNNSKCLIVDDLIATGGSMGAAKRLVEMSGSTVSAFAVIIELRDLKGRNKLGKSPLVTLFSY